MAKEKKIAPEVKSASSARMGHEQYGPMDFSTEGLGTGESRKRVAGMEGYDLPSPGFPDFEGETVDPIEKE